MTFNHATKQFDCVPCMHECINYLTDNLYYLDEEKYQILATNELLQKQLKNAELKLQISQNSAPAPKIISAPVPSSSRPAPVPSSRPTPAPSSHPDTLSLPAQERLNKTGLSAVKTMMGTNKIEIHLHFNNGSYDQELHYIINKKVLEIKVNGKKIKTKLTKTNHEDRDRYVCGTCPPDTDFKEYAKKHELYFLKKFSNPEYLKELEKGIYDPQFVIFITRLYTVLNNMKIELRPKVEIKEESSFSLDLTSTQHSKPSEIEPKVRLSSLDLISPNPDPKPEDNEREYGQISFKDGIITSITSDHPIPEESKKEEIQTFDPSDVAQFPNLNDKPSPPDSKVCRKRPAKKSNNKPLQQKNERKKAMALNTFHNTVVENSPSNTDTNIDETNEITIEARPIISNSNISSNGNQQAPPARRNNRNRNNRPRLNNNNDSRSNTSVNVSNNNNNNNNKNKKPKPDPKTKKPRWDSYPPDQ
jgi:hypothetical protein